MKASAAIRKYALPNLPYLFIFYLADKFGQAWRTAAGADIPAKMAGFMAAINTVFANPAPSLHLQDMAVGAVGALFIRLVVHVKAKNAKKYRKDVKYGSARWGTAEDIKPFVDPKFENNVILTASEQLTMNSRPKNPAHARNKNCLVVGGSGSGKTRFWLTPNAMQCHSSYVIVDPKGGVLTECGNLFLRKKYKLRVFNTNNFKKSMHYNPLTYIRKESDVLKLVSNLILNTQGTGKGGDDFWIKAETMLLCALIGYIVYETPEDERNFATLLEFLNAMEVREDDPEFKNAIDILFDELEKKEPGHFAVRQYRKFKLSSGRTTSSILVSCGARLAPFDIEEVREITMYDELALDTLGDEKTALFFIISDTDTTFNFLVTLAMGQMCNLLCEKADDVYGGRLPHHVRVLWDEAANTGQLASPSLPRLCAVVRSREISICLFLQAKSQLKALYKDDADTIIGNMDSVIFLGGREQGTLKELEETLGKETIDLYNTSVTKGTQESHGQNFQKLGKSLLSMDELAVLDGNKCVLQLRGVRPFLSGKYDLRQHHNYRYIADFNSKNAFKIERFLNNRMKLKPDDMFDAYDIDLSGDAR